MAGPSVVVRFLGDSSGLKKAADDVSDSGGKLTDFGKKAGLAIGGAFAAEKVIAFGKASVDAAAADAKAQATLAQQLKNSTGATDGQVKATEKSITAMSKHYAVADDDLRPALGNLVRATGDVTKSQDLLQVALDASAATGKDLNTITLAMGKAADGSTGGLAKLGIETKDAAGKALTADQVFKNMAATFKGQASTAADSAAGKMANAKIQFGEFQEQIGTLLLPVLSKMADLFSAYVLPAVSAFVSFITTNKAGMIAFVVGLAAVGAIVVTTFIAWAVAAAAAAIATLAAAAPFIAIGLAVAAVAFVIVKNWDTIRDTAVGAFNAVRDVIKGVWDWITTNWPLLLAVLTGPVGLFVLAVTRNFDRIKDAVTGLGRVFSTIWDGLRNGARAAFNFVADAWNHTVGALSFRIPGVGKGFDVPDIPHFAGGGVVTRPTLALLGEAGPEAVVPLGRGRPGPVMHIEHATFNDPVDVDVLAKQIEFALSAGLPV